MPPAEGGGMETSYGHNSRKISCDVYIDDKACVPDAVGVAQTN